jgi:hypothetical protein
VNGLEKLQKHNVGDQYLVLENGRFAYLSVPAQFTTSTTEAKLCFTDHCREAWDPLSACCLQEGAHVHAHVHHGEITEDIFLEQVQCSSERQIPLINNGSVDQSITSCSCPSQFFEILKFSKRCTVCTSAASPPYICFNQESELPLPAKIH